MHSLLKYLPVVISALLLLSCGTTTEKTQQPIPVRFNPASVSPTPKIVPGCEVPASTDPRGYRSPEFPMDQARKGNSGFAVMDFQINAGGKADNIEVVANAPEGAFSNHSVSALKKLNFSVAQKWAQTCATQKFRFAYQYAHSAECNPRAFPSDITPICVTVYITRLQ